MAASRGNRRNRYSLHALGTETVALVEVLAEKIVAPIEKSYCSFADLLE